MSRPPDLSTKAGRKAWTHEMRMVAVRPRRWGLWLLTAGVLLMLAPGALGVHDLWGWSPRFLGLVLAAPAVPLLALSVVLKRRYRRDRM
ncbi:hypothetical protein WG908_08410 [Sphingobium sp. AN641]|uniref:hypothetical protein n=1 Tax=Sphingobium sp. AN641 TaxID=3133443 RepID=UPI0030C5B3D5